MSRYRFKKYGEEYEKLGAELYGVDPELEARELSDNVRQRLRKGRSNFVMPARPRRWLVGVHSRTSNRGGQGLWRSL